MDSLSPQRGEGGGRGVSGSTLPMNQQPLVVGRDRRARRRRTGRPSGPALPGSWFQCVLEKAWKLSV